jgi:cardiolipin synthase (CMP-forming)
MAKGFYTIPNMITVARFAAIPVIVIAMARDAWMLAFVLFALSGISDGIDGYIARNFQQHSAVGAYLDPLADKALTFAVYSAFVYHGLLPGWLLVLIVVRDVAIIIGAGILTLRGKAGSVRPLMISKVNTAVLILLAAWVLASNAFGWSHIPLTGPLVIAVVVLTAVSAAAYGRKIVEYFRRTQANGPAALKQPDGLR